MGGISPGSGVGLESGSLEKTTSLSPSESFHARNLKNKQNEKGRQAAALLLDRLLEGGELKGRLGSEGHKELFSISQNSDLELFFEELLHFGIRQESRGNLEVAASVYAFLQKSEGGEGETIIAGASISPSVQIRKKAEERLNAILGQGRVGPRLEFLMGRFIKDATDYRMIVPMIAGSVVYRLVRASTLSRFASSANVTWFNRGLTARLSASSIGFASEVPTFTLLNRGLRQFGGEKVSWEAGAVGRDLLGATLVLGALKGFGFLGRRAFCKVHGIHELGTATRLNWFVGLSRPAIPQLSMFTGLLAAHKLEEKIGLRPSVEGATLVTDTLATLFSLGIGAHLGHRLLGPGFAKFQSEVGLQAEIYGNKVAGRKIRFFPEGANLPLGLTPALAVPGRGGSPQSPLRNLSIHMAISRESGGGKKKKSPDLRLVLGDRKPTMKKPKKKKSEPKKKEKRHGRVAYKLNDLRGLSPKEQRGILSGFSRDQQRNLFVYEGFGSEPFVPVRVGETLGKEDLLRKMDKYAFLIENYEELQSQDDIITSNIPLGVLFEGDSRSGKEFAARWIATSSRARLLKVGEFPGIGREGMTPKDIQDLFFLSREFVKQKDQPVILLWEGFDEVAKERSGLEFFSREMRLVEELIYQLKGTQRSLERGRMDGVFVIGITKDYERLDKILQFNGDLNFDYRFFPPNGKN